LPPVSGPAAVEAVWSCIRSDHAVIHASWVSSQPPSPAGSAAGAGGGPASCRTGGAGSARLAGGGPSSSATSVSSATGRRRPQRANTASPPASASNSPVISHTIRVPYPGHPPLDLAATAPAPGGIHAPIKTLGPSATCAPQRCHLYPAQHPSPPRPEGLIQRQTVALRPRAGDTARPGTTRVIHATTSPTRQSPAPD
jgi:hypothetical protein